MLVKTRWGLHTIATGGNLIGAAEVGIKTNRIKIGNFIMCSIMGGVAGILDAFRISSIDPLAGGTDIMFMAIASSVIGGTLLNGGSGTIIGAFFGAAVLGILKDGFTLSMCTLAVCVQREAGNDRRDFTHRTHVEVLWSSSSTARCVDSSDERRSARTSGRQWRR
jgi:ABC-type xylose transport system permease subunit